MSGRATRLTPSSPRPPGHRHACLRRRTAAGARPHLHQPRRRAAGFHTARQLARRQGAPLFELRAAIHDFESRGQPARAALIDTVRLLPADNVLPELAQPARYWFQPDRRAGSHPGRRHGLRRIETVVPEGFNRPRERRVLCFRANNGTNGPHGRQARRRAAKCPLDVQLDMKVRIL